MIRYQRAPIVLSLVFVGAVATAALVVTDASAQPLPSPPATQGATLNLSVQNLSAQTLNCGAALKVNALLINPSNAAITGNIETTPATGAHPFTAAATSGATVTLDFGVLDCTKKLQFDVVAKSGKFGVAQKTLSAKALSFETATVATSDGGNMYAQINTVNCGATFKLYAALKNSPGPAVGDFSGPGVPSGSFTLNAATPSKTVDGPAFDCSQGSPTFGYNVKAGSAKLLGTFKPKAVTF